jgi:hypothetical protein
LPAAVRNFDLTVVMKTSPSGDAKEYSFNLIDRSEYKPLFDFLDSKKLPIKNPQASTLTTLWARC